MAGNTGSRKNNPDWEETRSASGRKSYRKKNKGDNKIMGVLRKMNLTDDFQQSDDNTSESSTQNERYMYTLSTRERAAEQRTYDLVEKAFRGRGIDPDIQGQFYDNIQKGMSTWEAVDKIDYEIESSERTFGDESVRGKVVTEDYTEHPFKKKVVTTTVEDPQGKPESVEETTMKVDGYLITKTTNQGTMVYWDTKSDSPAHGAPGVTIDRADLRKDLSEEGAFKVRPRWRSSGTTEDPYWAEREAEGILKATRIAQQLQSLVDYETVKESKKSRD